MKTRFIGILCLLAIAVPLQSSSQNNIIKAFDKILKSSDVVYTEKHSMEKDTKTGQKESQYDIYDFTLPANSSLIDNALKAFKSDEAMAYSTSSGTAGKNDSEIRLAIGNGETGTRVNTPGRKYIYSCFLAPDSENKDGNYRYAYGMNWETKDGVITGKLIVTYATTLKYRQEQSERSQFKIFTNTTTYSGSTIENPSWFSKFMGYVQAMDNTSPGAQQALATKIYEHTKSTPTSVTREDKIIAGEILKSMISKPQFRNATATVQLLNGACSNLK